MSEERYSENASQVPAGPSENMSAARSQIGTELTQARSVAVHGYTYFVRDGEMIKIGSSIRPDERISSLQTGFPRELERLAVVPMDIAGEFETHQRFAHLRVRGEWFRAETELLDFIAALPGVKLPKAKISPREKKLAQIRGMVRRLPEGVDKEQLSLLAAQLENRAPSACIERQLGVIACRSQH